MVGFEEWNYKNKNVLKVLYNELIYMSLKYKIEIIDNINTYNNFLKMMYNESSKTVLSEELFPEYYDIFYHSDGYEDYKVYQI